VTATANTPFQVEPSGSEEGETLLTSVNIHCYSNDAYYGNSALQSGIIRANAVVWFEGICKVSDLYFKNLTAGSNCQIVICGLVVKKR
jgi:hypothetical protein